MSAEVECKFFNDAGETLYATSHRSTAPLPAANALAHEILAMTDKELQLVEKFTSATYQFDLSGPVLVLREALLSHAFQFAQGFTSRSPKKQDILNKAQQYFPELKR